MPVIVLHIYYQWIQNILLANIFYRKYIVAMGARSNFRRGGGKPKKVHPLKDEEAPHMEKKVAKRPSHGEEVAKTPISYIYMYIYIYIYI